MKRFIFGLIAAVLLLASVAASASLNDSRGAGRSRNSVHVD